MDAGRKRRGGEVDKKRKKGDRSEVCQGVGKRKRGSSSLGENPRFENKGSEWGGWGGAELQPVIVNRE